METPPPDYQQLTQMWLEFTGKMAAAVAKASEEAIPGDAAKQIRDTFFQALGQYTEQYMRSPQFLAMMKQSTETAVALRQQTNEFLAQVHQAAGGLSRQDLDGLLMAVRRCETRVLDKLDELSHRLGDLEGCVRALESSAEKPSRESK